MEPVNEPENPTPFKHPVPTNPTAATTEPVNEKTGQQFQHPQPTYDKERREAQEAQNAAAGPVDDSVVHYMGQTGNRLIWTITIFATVGFSLFGYDQGLMSGIIASEQFNSEFPATRQTDANDVHHGTVQGTVTSVYEVGAFLGAVAAFFIGDLLGRRRMMFCGGTIMILGTIIQVTAFGHSHGFEQFIVGRVVTGVGNGMNTASIPSWLAECSKAHNRGFLACVEASTVAVGTVVAYWMDFGLSFVNSSVSWRFPIAFQIVFAIILMGGVAFLPESPQWLLAHGYEAQALRVCAALNGVGINDPATIEQKDMILEGINAARRAQVASSKDVLKGGKKQNLRRMLIGASSQVFQQLGGCNAVIYYSTILFENQIGLETTLSLILGGVLSVVYAMGALSSFMLVERCGRRNLFLVGTVGQAVAMFITFGCLMPNQLHPGTGAEPAKGAAFGLFFFIAFFGATWLPLPWLYPAEINALSVRTQANAISTMCNWLFNFLVVQVLPTMTASIGAYTFLLFALANCIFFPIIWVYYPETTGHSLDSIDMVFARAYLSERRPTIIADEQPPLTDHQVRVLAERLDIHGTNDEETPGRGDAELDLSIPPPAPHEKTGGSTAATSENSSGNNVE